MGWKNVREHYRIEHIVHVTAGGDIYIGSQFAPEIIRISTDGHAEYQGSWGGVNESLERYLREMRSDPNALRELIAKPDTFEASLPVFTYDGAVIIEKQCESYGWPNVTHDGVLMYENLFFATRAAAVEAARTNAAHALNLVWRSLSAARAEVTKYQARRANILADLNKLDTMRET